VRPIPHVPVPRDLQEWFGDGRWWDRPGAFSDPYCRTVVADLDATLGHLRQLYDDEACLRLVAAGHGRMVYGLFGGFTQWVDRLLQLGADLALCDGWSAREKLAGSLRSPDGFDGARFEIGVWAGLRRVGLVPQVEPAVDLSRPRADFVVHDQGMDVALELKALSDSAFERNRYLVSHVLGNMFIRVDGQGLRGNITLKLSDEAVALLYEHEDFYERHLPRFDAELVAALPHARSGTATALPTIGTLIAKHGEAGDPPGSIVGGYQIDAGEESDPVSRVRRALHRVKQSERQLSATPADLRAVVIYGSMDELPAAWSAEAAGHLVGADRATWDPIPVDWIVFLNGHRRSTVTAHWITEIAVCRLPHATSEIPDRILRGLSEWGELWQGPAR
jgi:hypothetical protein